MDEARLRRDAKQVLQRLGPMPVAALADELTEHDVDAELVYDILLDENVEEGGFVAFPLRDGRLCDLDDLLEGVTLTHELSDDERDSGELEIDPDLMAIHILSPDGRTFPLADGRHATSTEHDFGRITGPEGWLPAAPVIQATIREGRIELTGRQDLPEPDEGTVDRLDDVIATAEEHGWNLDGVELILQARARFPRLFTDAHAPVSELLAAAGLRMTNRGVVDVDDDDPTDPAGEFVDDLVDHLREDHGFDDHQVRIMMELQRTTLQLSNRVLRASLERIKASIDAETDDIRDLDADDADLGDLDADDAELEELARAALDDVDVEEARDHLAAALEDREMTAAVIEDVVGWDPIASSCVLALVELTTDARRERRLRANAAWLAARCLEVVADDHAAAEQQLRRAVELDPDNASAAFQLASYLSHRGEAGAALKLLREIEGAGVDQLTELLSRFVQPGPASAGRNEPCPCGSGRKHKVCCQARNGWPLQERIGWVWNKVFDFMTSPAVHELVAPILRAVEAGREQAATGDLAITNLTLFEGGLLAEFCDRRGSLLPADELELVRTWSRVRGAAFEIVEIDRDDRLTLLDLTSGERVGFVDHTMARNLDVGEAMLAWIVPEPDGPVPHHGVVLLPPGRREQLLALLDEEPTADELIDWYRSLSAPPRLATTAGDPLEHITQVFSVPDVEAARTALAHHLEEAGDDRMAAFEERDGQRWLRGSVAFDAADGQLTVSTLSAKRAAWFNELVTDTVDGAELVDEERRGSLDVAHPEADPFGSDDVDEPGLDLDALDPQDRAALEEQLDQYMTEHEDRWLDLEIPALGGATPRQAAQDPTRREQLEQLLAEMERHAAGWTSPGRPMDAERLRRLLELET